MQSTVFRLRKRAYHQWRYGRRRRPLCHVFVGGVQRSGTNMLTSLFENSLETVVYNENDARAYIDYELREEDLLRGLSARCKAPYLVFKALCDLDRLPILVEVFAPAKLVWLSRHYTDVVNSMLVSFKTVPMTVQRIAQNGEAAGWWGRGLSSATRELLRYHAARNLNDHSLAALLWYLRNVLYFEAGWHKDARTILVSYEELVLNPGEQCRRLFKFCGLRFTRRIVRHVHARSIQRREPPPIDAEVAALCDELLSRFEQRLRTDRRRMDHQVPAPVAR